MQPRGSLRVLKNIPEESSEKTVTDIHQQILAETYDTIEDLTYKMPPHRHEDETESEDKVLMKIIKKIKLASKPSAKQLQMRSKKCARAKAEKERKSLKKSPSHEKHRQLSVVQPDHQKKSPKQHANTSIGDQCKWIVDNFDPYSVTLYVTTEKKIEITPMNVHLTLTLPIGGRKVEEFYGKKSKDPEYNEVLSA
ncbi:hypothetical protein Cgig2_014463 [Carnegiea gigantea]|uniref:Uncharacterized protein n=1 Tax=Carnegiea gigantea TaxID=171969 RepID=A0A9Q1K951_9CARY|nr:hypothetical protein Cgig2_014463 [Carnegiea gigantea]